MPRDPVKDYADRCKAIELERTGMTHGQIAQVLYCPEWRVRRTFARYDPQAGLDSLQDHSSRPHRSPNQTPPEVEKAICTLKQAHPAWERRQIAKQLRWRWRANPTLLHWAGEGRVRRILALSWLKMHIRSRTGHDV
jgi:hypothetical protein